jgi:hypothetical protein
VWCGAVTSVLCCDCCAVTSVLWLLCALCMGAVYECVCGLTQRHGCGSAGVVLRSRGAASPVPP